MESRQDVNEHALNPHQWENLELSVLREKGQNPGEESSPTPPPHQPLIGGNWPSLLFPFWKASVRAESVPCLLFPIAALEPAGQSWAQEGHMQIPREQEFALEVGGRRTSLLGRLGRVLRCWGLSFLFSLWILSLGIWPGEKKMQEVGLQYGGIFVSKYQLFCRNSDPR